MLWKNHTAWNKITSAIGQSSKINGIHFLKITDSTARSPVTSVSTKRKNKYIFVLHECGKRKIKFLQCIDSAYLQDNLFRYHSDINNFLHKIGPDCVLRFSVCRLRIQGNRPFIKNALLAKCILNTCLDSARVVQRTEKDVLFNCCYLYANTRQDHKKEMVRTFSFPCTATLCLCCTVEAQFPFAHA